MHTLYWAPSGIYARRLCWWCELVSAFAVTSLDHVFEVVPLPEAVVLHHQRLVKRIRSMAMGLPRRAPYVALCDSVNSWG